MNDADVMLRHPAIFIFLHFPSANRREENVLLPSKGGDGVARHHGGEGRREAVWHEELGGERGGDLRGGTHTHHGQLERGAEETIVHVELKAEGTECLGGDVGFALRSVCNVDSVASPASYRSSLEDYGRIRDGYNRIQKYVLRDRHIDGCVG